MKLPASALNFYNMVGLWTITTLGFVSAVIALLVEVWCASRRRYETQ